MPGPLPPRFRSAMWIALALVSTGALMQWAVAQAVTVMYLEGVGLNREECLDLLTALGSDGKQAILQIAIRADCNWALAQGAGDRFLDAYNDPERDLLERVELHLDSRAVTGRESCQRAAFFLGTIGASGRPEMMIWIIAVLGSVGEGPLKWAMGQRIENSPLLDDDDRKEMLASAEGAINWWGKNRSRFAEQVLPRGARGEDAEDRLVGAFARWGR